MKKELMDRLNRGRVTRSRHAPTPRTQQPILPVKPRETPTYKSLEDLIESCQAYSNRILNTLSNSKDVSKFVHRFSQIAEKFSGGAAKIVDKDAETLPTRWAQLDVPLIPRKIEWNFGRRNGPRKDNSNRIFLTLYGK